MNNQNLPPVSEPDAWRDATNPVLRGFRPDPSVCRVDGADGTWFYCANSSFEYLPGIPIHRSRDLVDWEPVGHVVTGQLDYDGVHDSGGLYAPTIRHDGSRFLVVCTLLREGAPAGNFVMTAVDAHGPWSEPTWWHDSTGVDPSLLLDHDGTLWAHGARAADSPLWPDHGEIWVRRMDPGTLTLGPEETVVWSGAMREAQWVEGPHLYRRGSFVHLVSAEGGTGIHHAVITARSQSPTGPFEGAKGNPALTHRHLGPGAAVVNVGHADLVQAADGSWWALVLATRMADGVDLLGRETFLVPVCWQDDRPVFAPGVGTLVPEPGGPSGARRQRRPSTEWVGVRRLPETIARGVGTDRVSIIAGAGLEDLVPAFLGSALRHPDSVICADVPQPPMGVELGLALRTSSRDWVAAMRQGDVLTVTACVAGSATVVGEVPAHGAGRLEVTVCGRGGSVQWRSDTAAARVTDLDLSHLATSRAGGFVGVVAGALAVGRGEYVFGRLDVRESPS